jgi:hypothetical protein
MVGGTFCVLAGSFGWPLWFSAYAFRHTRRFTSLFLLSVILDTLLLLPKHCRAAAHGLCFT